MVYSTEEKLVDWINLNKTELNDKGYIVDDIDYIFNQEMIPMKFLLEEYSKLDDLNIINDLSVYFIFEFCEVDLLRNHKSIDNYKAHNPGRVFCKKLNAGTDYINFDISEIESELAISFQPQEKYISNKVKLVESDIFEFSQGVKFKKWFIFIQVIVFDEKDELNKNILNSNIIVIPKNLFPPSF